MGYGEKEKRRISYSNPHDRWRGEGGAEAKPSANGRFFKLYFIHSTSPSILASDIFVVWVVSIPTSYIFRVGKNSDVF
jgi:hypothetical protein